MYIHISFIPLQDFDVIYYFLCFSLILKVELNYKMKWKCIFSKISPQSNPLREVITPPTKLPAGMPDRATGLAGRLCARRGRLLSKADWLHHHATSQAHSIDDAKVKELPTSLVGTIVSGRCNTMMDYAPTAGITIKGREGEGKKPWYLFGPSRQWQSGIVRQSQRQQREGEGSRAEQCPGLPLEGGREGERDSGAKPQAQMEWSLYAKKYGYCRCH